MRAVVPRECIVCCELQQLRSVAEEQGQIGGEDAVLDVAKNLQTAHSPHLNQNTVVKSYSYMQITNMLCLLCVRERTATNE